MELRAQTRVIGSGLLIAVVALAFGFLLAGQLRAQLLNPSNRVARNEALVRSVQDLEKTNADYRARINALRTEMTALEAQAAAGSDSTRRLQDQDRELKQRAGLTQLRGPGVTVDLANGRPGTDPEGVTGYLVNFADVQDVVNLLFEAGAEGVAINGRRISPLSSFRGAAGAIVVDQGPPLLSPYRVSAVGNRGQMEQLLADSSNLGNLRSRVTRFQLRLASSGSPDLNLPAFDSALEAPNAIPQ